MRAGDGSRRGSQLLFQWQYRTSRAFQLLAEARRGRQHFSEGRRAVSRRDVFAASGLRQSAISTFEAPAEELHIFFWSPSSFSTTIHPVTAAAGLPTRVEDVDGLRIHVRSKSDLAMNHVLTPPGSSREKHARRTSDGDGRLDVHDPVGAAAPRGGEHVRASRGSRSTSESAKWWAGVENGALVGQDHARFGARPPGRLVHPDPARQPAHTRSAGRRSRLHTARTSGDAEVQKGPIRRFP